MKRELTTLINDSISQAITSTKNEIPAYINDLFDRFIIDRIGRKFLTIEKTDHKWINLLDNTELKLKMSMMHFNNWSFSSIVT